MSRRFNMRVQRGFFALNIASVVEKMDESVLPAVFFFIGQSLGASLSQLGSLTLARALMQACTSPLAGMMGEMWDRKVVITSGAVLWGFMTAAIGCAGSLDQAIWFCALNGFGLALVIPSISSLVADEQPVEKRGRAFGTLNFTSGLGGMAAALLATNMGGRSFRIFNLISVEGWRMAFFAIACISFIAAIVVFLWVEDPRQMGHRMNWTAGLAPEETNQPAASTSYSHSSMNKRSINARFIAASYKRKSIHEIGKEMMSILKVKSFQIIVLQGVVGSMPWQAMLMFTLLFQLLGFSNAQSSIIVALFTLGCSIGGFLGGLLGDWAAMVWPNHGRILVAQICVLSGIPFSFLLLKGLPLPFQYSPKFDREGVEDGSLVASTSAPVNLFILYCATLACMGLCISWCGVNNSAFFAELVPENLRTHIYAFDRSFEGAIGACGSPLVGLIAERIFGFRGSLREATHLLESRTSAVHALSNALLFSLIIPWIFCFLFYLMLYSTLQKDKIAALKSSTISKDKDLEQQHQVMW